MKWLLVKNYPFYEVSECGQVRSIDKPITIIDSRNNTEYTKICKGRLLKQTIHKDTKYKQVSLWDKNQGTWKYVHRLVCEAFHENPLNKDEVNHKDGDRQNNHFSNLEWVTRSENAIHAVETELRTYTNRLTKKEFLECLIDVINGESYLSLSQRVPYKVPFLSTKLRKIAKEFNLEHELNESLYEQKIERARENGNKNKR